MTSCWVKRLRKCFSSSVATPKANFDSVGVGFRDLVFFGGCFGLGLSQISLTHRCRDSGGFMGIMDRTMETTILWGTYWGHVGIIQKKTETTILWYHGIGPCFCHSLCRCWKAGASTAGTKQLLH